MGLTIGEPYTSHSSAPNEVSAACRRRTAHQHAFTSRDQLPQASQQYLPALGAKEASQRSIPSLLRRLETLTLRVAAARLHRDPCLCLGRTGSWEGSDRNPVSGVVGVMPLTPCAHGLRCQLASPTADTTFNVFSSQRHPVPDVGCRLAVQLSRLGALTSSTVAIDSSATAAPNGIDSTDRPWIDCVTLGFEWT